MKDKLEEYIDKIGKDKLIHFAVIIIIYLIFSVIHWLTVLVGFSGFPSAAKLFAVIAIAFLKEVYDNFKKKGSFSWEDFYFGAGAGILAFLIDIL